MKSKKRVNLHVLREELRQLVDSLPDEELFTAKRFMVYLRNLSDPVLRTLLEAPDTDEPLSKEGESAVDEAWQAAAKGQILTDEELGHQLET